MNDKTSFVAGGILLLLAACTSKTLDGGSSKTDGGDESSSGGSATPADGDGAVPDAAHTRRLGDECEDDDVCLPGLTCHPNYVASQCTAIKTCTVICSGNAACQALDPKAMCFEGCTSSESICMLTP